MLPIFQRKSLLLFALGLSLSADTRTNSRPFDVVHYWNEAGAIMPLERAAIVPVAASPAVSASWEIQGGRSSIRIKRGPAMLFVVSLADGISPDKFQLFRLTGSGVRKPYPPHDAWRTATLSVTKAGDSYGLAPVGELVEGEYAFIRAGTTQAYCFGIDRAN
jgi:hypothetical protein